jgi:hypothetical protein
MLVVEDPEGRCFARDDPAEDATVEPVQAIVHASQQTTPGWAVTSPEAALRPLTANAAVAGRDGAGAYG